MAVLTSVGTVLAGLLACRLLVALLFPEKLDPHISPAAACLQVGRDARARGLPEVLVKELVGRQVEGRTLGLLGEPRVNALAFIQELDELARPSS